MFGIIAVLFIGGLVAGAVVYTMQERWRVERVEWRRLHRPSLASRRSRSRACPAFRSGHARCPNAAPGTDPDVITGTPGQVVTVSGIDENKTVTCNDATVNISGIRNTVNITGHCVKVSVSASRTSSPSTPPTR